MAHVARAVPAIVVTAEEDAEAHDTGSLINGLLKKHPDLPIVRIAIRRSTIGPYTSRALPVRTAELVNLIRSLPLQHLQESEPKVRERGWPMRYKSCLPLLTLGILLAEATSRVQAQSPQEGEALFREKCAACHTIGRGKLVGPDLQGVTTRRERAWLARWIQAPDRMMAERDPAAMQLLKEFNYVPMPNLGLKDQQVKALIAYLESLEAGTSAPSAVAIPSLYFPTLIAAVVAVAGLTALGLLAARKRVEVRP